VELTAFVGVGAWPTAAVDQPPPQSRAPSAHTHAHTHTHTHSLTLSASDCVRVRICVFACLAGLPVRHTVKPFCLSSPPSSSPLLSLSRYIHLSIPPSFHRSLKEGQVSQPRHLRSTLSIYLSAHSSAQSICPSLSWRNNNNPHRLPPFLFLFFPFLQD